MTIIEALKKSDAQVVFKNKWLTHDGFLFIVKRRGFAFVTTLYEGNSEEEAVKHLLK